MRLHNIIHKTMVFYSVLILVLAFTQIVSTKNLISKTLSDENYAKNIGWLFDLEESAEDESEEFSVCETDGCNSLAEHIRKGMNKSVNPCDDFYAYVCGGWSEDLIPPNAYAWGNTQLFQDIVLRRVADILNAEPQPTDILPVRQAKKWYKSCTDVKERERRGIKPVESILLQGGGWPMIMDPEEWDESDYSWKKIEDHYFYITGSFMFYTIAPSWRRFDEEFKGEILISEGKLPMSWRKNGNKNLTGEHYVFYKNLIQSIAKAFAEHSKADVSDDMIEKDVKDLVDFEKKLQELVALKPETEESTIGDFTDAYNEYVDELLYKIDFKDRLKMVLNVDNVDIDDSTPIMVIPPEYYVNLTQLLSETSVRTIANYLHWNFVSNVILFTSEEVMGIIFKVAEDENSALKPPPQWEQCIRQLPMRHAFTYAYVTKYFQDSTEKATLKMIENIRKEMETKIDNSNWFDDEAKKLTKDKLKSIKMYVGFHDWYRNRTAVMNMYKGLKIGYDYFENMLSYQKYEKKMLMDAMRNNDAEGPWGGMYGVVVNAWYDELKNRIGLPAANFQPPLFGHQVPESINYGLAGNVVGHEIGHAFDIEGIKYDQDGNHTKLSDEIIEMYYKQARCFLDQYNEYYGVTEPVYEGTTPQYGEGSLGRITRAENMADTTGLDAVFEAYRKVQEKKPKGDSKLPGFEEYTDEQMFFLSYAVSWCEIERPEATNFDDVHSPSRLRVIGPLSNSKEFTGAFHCPTGSTMNPEDKCNIWRDEEKRKQSNLLLRNRSKHGRWVIN